MPIHTTSGEAFKHLSERQKKKEDPRSLLAEPALIELLDVMSDGAFKVTPRLLRTFYSPKVGLIRPPIPKESRPCYLFPDHHEQLMLILTLRQIYRLPLASIKPLIEHFPEDSRHLIIDRKLSFDELMDMARMIPQGYKVEDFILAKTCDLMTEDVVSPAKAVLAAADPGDGLKRLEEEAIFSRLDAIKAWISSGRRQEFVTRESAEAIQHLAQKQLAARKVARKVQALSTRLASQ